MAVVSKECKGCGVTFDITEKEQKWYEEHGFKLPERCSKCRAARREAKKGAPNVNAGKRK